MQAQDPMIVMHFTSLKEKYESHVKRKIWVAWVVRKVRVAVVSFLPISRYIKISTVFGDSESQRCQSCEQHELWSRRDCAAALRMAGLPQGNSGGRNEFYKELGLLNFISQGRFIWKWNYKLLHGWIEFSALRKEGVSSKTYVNDCLSYQWWYVSILGTFHTHVLREILPLFHIFAQPDLYREQLRGSHFDLCVWYFQRKNNNKRICTVWRSWRTYILLSLCWLVIPPDCDTDSEVNLHFVSIWLWHWQL